MGFLLGMVLYTLLESWKLGEESIMLKEILSFAHCGQNELKVR